MKVKNIQVKLDGKWLKASYLVELNDKEVAVAEKIGYEVTVVERAGAFGIVKPVKVIFVTSKEQGKALKQEIEEAFPK